jgi:hypothetical protein
MNVEHMVQDLRRLKKEWERNANSLDVVGDHNCALNVLRGIALSWRIVRAHWLAPHTLRGPSKVPYKDSRDKKGA